MSVAPLNPQVNSQVEGGQESSEPPAQEAKVEAADAQPTVQESKVQAAVAPFLQENQPLANLALLSNPKYPVLPPTACVTREVYQNTPFFKPSREAIQRFATGAASLFVIAPLVVGVFHRTLLCMGFKDWQSQFYSISSDCASRAIADTLGPGNRNHIMAWTLLTSMWGFGTYTSARIFFRDSQDQFRIRTLRKVYADLAETLSNPPQSDNADMPKNIIIHRRIAASLKVNLPLIRERLKTVARIDAAEAALITHKLSAAADRILGGSR